MSTLGYVHVVFVIYGYGVAQISGFRLAIASGERSYDVWDSFYPITIGIEEGNRSRELRVLVDYVLL